MSTHGGRANKTGKTLESIVTPVLTAQYGFEVISHPSYVEIQTGILPRPKRLLVTRVPYTTLYGSAGTTEFLLVAQNARSTKEFPISATEGELVCRIECKWQQSAGSVDEKFPYLYLSCVEAMPETNIIILHGGGMFRPGAMTWLKRSVSEKRYMTSSNQKNIAVMAVEEFMKWASHAFDSYQPQ
jgi:hypothetical protein